MKEKEIEKNPFSLAVIPVFYGYMAIMSTLGFSEPYVLFSVILPQSVSMVVVAIETSILVFLTVGLFKKQKVARTILIGYNLYAITDILFTLIFINKDKLMAFLKVDAVALEEYASINLFFCFLLFIIFRYVRTHKEYFTK
jgi:hypothetical protein